MQARRALAAAALEVCIREHDTCSEGLAPAQRHLSRPGTSAVVVAAITQALAALPRAAGLPTWQAALAELAAAAATSAPWAMQRLAKLAAWERPWRVALAQAQKAGAMHLTATASLERVLETDLAGGLVDADLWSTFLALADEQPGRRVAWTVRPKDPAAAGAAIDLLIHHGGISAALTATDLLLLLDARERGEPAWAARAAAVQAMHADAAERLVLAGGSRR